MRTPIRLKSGKSIEPAFGIVGIDDELVVFEGYDGRLGAPGEGADGDPYLDPAPLTPTEFMELADVMIGRWQALKENAAKVAAEGRTRQRLKRKKPPAPTA